MPSSTVDATGRFHGLTLGNFASNAWLLIKDLVYLEISNLLTFPRSHPLCIR